MERVRTKANPSDAQSRRTGSGRGRNVKAGKRYASAAAFAPATRPNTNTSVMEQEPRRFVPILWAGPARRREQAGDGRAVAIEHLRVGIDVQAAHGVVHRRLVRQDVVRAALDGIERRAVVEVGIGAILTVAVPLLHGLLQLSGIDAERFTHLGNGFALRQLAAPNKPSISAAFTVAMSVWSRPSWLKIM